jgi:imidazolonepropionase-like amidohydrolase
MTRHRFIPRLSAALLAAALLAGCGEKLPDLVQLPASKPAALHIKGVSVLDVESGTLTANRDVIVIGDRIAAIAPAGAAEVPPGAQEIDGSGATLLPGLIDMHSHLGNASAPRWAGELPDPPRNMQAYLYCGVTTVFDAGGLAPRIFGLRDDAAAGKLLGPRIYATGPIFTAKGGHPAAVLEVFAPWWIRWYLIPRYARQLETPEEARLAVREIAGMGADAIKLAVDRIPEQTPRLQRELIDAVVNEARALKLRSVAHIGTVQDAIDAADAGVALWVHGVYKERIPDDQIARLAAYRIPMVPTIGVFEGYALLGRGPRVPSKLERETQRAEVLAAFDSVPQSEDMNYFRAYLENLYAQRQNWRDNVRRLHATGVTILAGSDTQSGVFPGAGLHRELLLLQESGLTPAEVIRAATLDAARYLAGGEALKFGAVREGLQADLLLVEGNPLQDLRALENIRHVIKGGVPLQRRALNAGG